MCNLMTIATVGLHLVSLHTEPDYNNINPGIYIRNECNIQVGYYFNSVKKDSFYVSYIKEHDTRPLYGGIGLVTGYRKYPVPFIFAGIKITESVRATILPSPETITIHTTIEF